MAANDPAGPDTIGQWEELFDLQNVAIHAHLLRTGKVLYWGRRSEVGNPGFNTLNEHLCSTFLWDPVTGEQRATVQQPQLIEGQGVNLFCSGHSFLPDGRLLVVGGHLFDEEGVNQACVYDPGADTWSALERMNAGRWYPSALTLPDGSVLAISGSFIPGGQQPPPYNLVRSAGNPTPNPNPQIWRGNTWAPTTDFQTLLLYPRLHVEPKRGDIFMAGPQPKSYFLNVDTGMWTGVSDRVGALREYAPSVMYTSGKIIFIGGGLDKDPLQPTNICEIIDLNDPIPQWQQTKPMNFRRRQHNATVLPDGTVLVTGGTQDLPGNPDWLAFNNLDPTATVHKAELWDPVTGQWTIMAEESKDRCYHSTALLLPDGKVFSAGGGEYDPKVPGFPDTPNPPGDSHQDAQLFSPPYLLKGIPQPTITSFPEEINYGETFNVGVGPLDSIDKVSWIRLGSVTHSSNQNQLCVFLEVVQAGASLTVTAPENSNIAPPGHYMLFVLNKQGVPSKAPIIHITAPAGNAVLAQRRFTAAPAIVNLISLSRKIAKAEKRPPVVVGVTPTCPYGIGACWGGAFGALQQLSDVKVVRPFADAADSLAFVYLQEDLLPNLDKWRTEFAEQVNGTYTIRGVEMTLSGLVTEHQAQLTLTGTTTRPALVLAPLQAANKVQWDIRTRDNRPMSDLEDSAFDRLAAALVDRPTGLTALVTGPLVKKGEDFVLQVREFQVPRGGIFRQTQRWVTRMLAWLSSCSCFP